MIVGFIVETFYKGALEIGLILGLVTPLEDDEFEFVVEIVEFVVLVIAIIGETTIGSKEPSSMMLIGLV